MMATLELFLTVTRGENETRCLAPVLLSVTYSVLAGTLSKFSSLNLDPVVIFLALAFWAHERDGCLSLYSADHNGNGDLAQFGLRAGLLF